MQTVTDAVKQLVDSYAKVTLAVYIDGEKLDAGVGDGSYSGACAGDDEFSFGNACAAGANVTLAVSRPDLKGHRIQITWTVDGTEHPLLTGEVKKAKVVAGRTEIEAWDDMYFAGSKAFAFTSAVSDTCTAAAAFTAVANSMGVSVDSAALALLSGITIPGGLSGLNSDVTNSAVVGYIAGLVGGNAIMSRAGQLTICQYAAVGWETEPYSGGASAENKDFTVTGITLQREITVAELNDDGSTTERTATEEYTAGDGLLMLANPLASQVAADSAYAALSAVTVRPGNYSFPGGLLLEPGDIFTVHSMDGSYAVAVGSISMTFDGGVRSSVACGGVDEDSGGAQGAINQALKALAADYAKFKKLAADNAEINSANILELIAGDILAGRIKTGILQSKDGKTFYLDLENGILKGDFSELTISGKALESMGITSVEVYYYLSTSSTVLSGGSWSKDAPTWENGKFIWSKTVTTYSDGTTSESDPACITGGKGEDAVTCRIDSSAGFVLKEGDSTTLTARIFVGTEEIDPDGEMDYTWYRSLDGAAYQAFATGKTVTVSESAYSNYADIYFTTEGGEVAYDDITVVDGVMNIRALANNPMQSGSVLTIT